MVKGFLTLPSTLGTSGGRGYGQVLQDGGVDDGAQESHLVHLYSAEALKDTCWQVKFEPSRFP